MNATLLRRLRLLASLELQRRYIVRGTRESYVVPSEILNDALSISGDVRVRSPEPTSPSLDDRKAILTFLATLEAHFSKIPEDISNEDLVERNSDWAAL